MTPETLGHTIFAPSSAPVVVESIDGSADDSGQWVCFEASTLEGAAVAQVNVRDAGTYAEQLAVARDYIAALGYRIAESSSAPPPGYAIRADGLFGAPYYAIIDDDFGFIVTGTYATREQALSAAWVHYNESNKGELS